MGDATFSVEVTLTHGRTENEKSRFIKKLRGTTLKMKLNVAEETKLKTTKCASAHEFTSQEMDVKMWRARESIYENVVNLLAGD